MPIDKQSDEGPRHAFAHTVAVSGYYGCGNAGDEAVLAGIQEAFRVVAGDAVRLLPLSQNPDATRSLHGLDAVYRMDMAAVRAALKESDLLLSGGGSLLQDTTSLRSLVYYLWVVRMALRLKVPVMFYAQGIGPLRRPIARWLVRWTANRVSYITVRDEASARLLASIGVTGPPLEVTADPAFALRPAPADAVNACLPWKPGPGGDRWKVGIALRPWGGDRDGQIAEYASLLHALEDRTGAELILIPMQLPGDAAFSNAVCEKAGRAYLIAQNCTSPAVLLGLIGKMDAIVAMRLHTLIFAARMEVPAFALAYDPKVDSLMQALQVEDSVASWQGFDPQNVADKVKSLLDERPARSRELRQRAAVMESQAIRNAEIAISLVMKRAGV